jgi:hypothetical protein
MVCVSLLLVSHATMDVPNGPSALRLVPESDVRINPMVPLSTTSLVENSNPAPFGGRRPRVSHLFGSKGQFWSWPLLSLGGPPAADLVSFSGCWYVHPLTYHCLRRVDHGVLLEVSWDNPGNLHFFCCGAESRGGGTV